MAPIRILHVVTKMDAAGIETLLMNLYRKIDRKKIQFDFLVHRNDAGFYDDEINSLGGKIYNIPSINPIKHKKYLNALDLFFKSNKDYNIIHSHINTFSMYPLRAAMNAGVKTRIAHSHIANPEYDFKAPFKIYAKFHLRKYCTHLFACSEWAGKWLYGENNVDFKVVNNAIDAEEFIYNKSVRKAKRSEFLINNKIVFGHVGRFNIQKNHGFLLDIFKEINIKNPNTVLMLIGDGELRSNIIKKIQSLQLQDDVILTGVRSNIPELLQAMDAFIFPSLYEGLPVTVIEAQAAGLPCIISDNITSEVRITNLVDQVSLDKSPIFWAERIINNLEKSKRKNTFNQIVKAGYDMNSVVKWYEEFYLTNI